MVRLSAAVILVERTQPHTDIEAFRNTTAGRFSVSESLPNEWILVFDSFSSVETTLLRPLKVSYIFTFLRTHLISLSSSSNVIDLILYRSYVMQNKTKAGQRKNPWQNPRFTRMGGLRCEVTVTRCIYARQIWNLLSWLSSTSSS